MIAFVAFLLASTLAADDVPRMTIDEFRAAATRGEVVAIDVRGNVPYSYGHIEGAVSIPLGLIASKGGELPRDKTLVAYCTCAAEELSIRAARELRKLGFTRVAALTGGYAAWVGAGHPVVKLVADEAPPPPPIPSSELPEPPAMSRGGRLMPPAQIRCKADDVTVYFGRVISYTRTKTKTTLRIRTDYDTTETVTLAHPKNGDPSRWFLVTREPFRAADWKKIEVRRGVLRPGMRAHAWVCKDWKAIIDWRPDEVEAVE